MLTALAYRLVRDDACLVIAEIVAHHATKAANHNKASNSLERPAAQGGGSRVSRKK